MPTFLFSSSQGPSQLGRTRMISDLHTQGTMALIGTNPKIGWQMHRSIVTRMTVGFQGNYQFLHTLGNDIYIYVFGDRMGQLSISGLSMAANCEEPDASAHGFELVMEWYAQNRVASRQSPIVVTIGRTTIEGFVVGLQGEASDTANRLIQYSMQMVVLPEKTNQAKLPNTADGNDPSAAYINQHGGVSQAGPSPRAYRFSNGSTYDPYTGISTPPTGTPVADSFENDLAAASGT